MKIAVFLKRPVFEVKAFPASELEYWCAYFSIMENKDKPKFKVIQSNKQNQESIRALLEYV